MRKKSTVPEYPMAANQNQSNAYNGEIVEAQVVTAEDYIGTYDEYGEKSKGMDHHHNNGYDKYSNGDSFRNNYNVNMSNSNSARRASTQTSVTSSSSSSSASVSPAGPNPSTRRASAMPNMGGTQQATSYGYAGSSSTPLSQMPMVQTSAEISAPVETQSYTFRQWPPKLRSLVIETFSRPMNERRGREFMTQNDWPVGLQSGLIRSCQKFPMRYFIIDDSGSMCTNDGRRVAGTGSNAKVIQCTRWAELVSGLKFHAELSERLGCVSEVRLLNGADPCMVGLGDDDGEGLRFAQSAFDDSPGGQTPLCKHICAVVESLTSIADELRKMNKKVCLFRCSD
jgi:hypothetical protein